MDEKSYTDFLAMLPGTTILLLGCHCDGTGY